MVTFDDVMAWRGQTDSERERQWTFWQFFANFYLKLMTPEGYSIWDPRGEGGLGTKNKDVWGTFAKKNGRRPRKNQMCRGSPRFFPVRSPLRISNAIALSLRSVKITRENLGRGFRGSWALMIPDLRPPTGTVLLHLFANLSFSQNVHWEMMQEASCFSANVDVKNCFTNKQSSRTWLTKQNIW